MCVVTVQENPVKLKRPNNMEGLCMYGSMGRNATYRPAEFLAKPASGLVVHEGKRLSAWVRVSGVPVPQVSWFREGKPVRLREADDSRYRIFERDGLHFFEIENTSILDAGEYTCTASNVMGAVYSSVNVVIEAMTEPDSCEDLERTAERRQSTSTTTDTTDNNAAPYTVNKKNFTFREKKFYLLLKINLSLCNRKKKFLVIKTI